MMNRILTANRLLDGAVVYRNAAGAWVDRIAEAAPVTDEKGEQALLAAAAEGVAARQIVGPYLIDVGLNGAGPEPQSQRERIRAAGPTVDYRRIKAW